MLELTHVPFWVDDICDIWAAISMLQCFSVSYTGAAIEDMISQPHPLAMRTSSHDGWITLQCFLFQILSRGDSWNTWDEKTPSCERNNDSSHSKS